jgi:EmrB/QacA subfamily drug resistance transporter
MFYKAATEGARMHESTITAGTNPHRWRILVVLCISVFLAVVDNTIVNVALPTLSRSLNATISDLQWVVDAYALVFASLLLVGGSLGDRFGRKGALQVGLVGFALCSLGASFASTTGQLIVGRAAMGVFAALVFPATLAILTNVFTDEAERAKAIGVWSGVVGLAVALGPITGGILLRHFWWGSIFLVNLPIAAIALVAGARLVPTSRDPETPPLDFGGFALSIVGIVALVFTIIEGPSFGWKSARTLGGFGIAAVVLVGFALWERRSDHPMLDVRTFANIRFTAASTSITVGFFALFGFIFLITQYFQFVRGYDTLSAGVHTLPFAIGTGISAPISASLALRFGPRLIIGTGLAVMSAGFVVASTLKESTPYVGAVAISMVLIALGFGAVTAPSTTAILAVLPKEKAGIGSAINDVTRELGGTIGVAVIGSVFASVYGPRVVSKLNGLAIPEPALEAAKSSVAAALAVAEQAPEQVRPLIANAARSAFTDGLSAGTLVAAGAVAAGSLFAFAVLPKHRDAATAAVDVE